MKDVIEELRRIGSELSERGHESLSNELEVAVQRFERRADKSAELFTMARKFIDTKKVDDTWFAFQSSSADDVTYDFLRGACAIIGYYDQKD